MAARQLAGKFFDLIGDREEFASMLKRSNTVSMLAETSGMLQLFTSNSSF